MRALQALAPGRFVEVAGERVLADLLDPEEPHGRQVESCGHPGHDVAQEDAEEHVDHGDQHEHGDRDVGQPGEDAQDGAHRGEAIRSTPSLSNPGLTTADDRVNVAAPNGGLP